MGITAASASRPARTRVPAAGRGFGRDLTAMVPDALFALAFTALTYLWLWGRVESGVSPAQITMGKSMGVSGMRAYTVSQAFGFAAVVWSWGTLLLGLAVSTDFWRSRAARRNTVEQLHRTTSLTTIALTVAHAVALLWDRMSSATPVQLFVPFASHYSSRRFPLALGILALYGALLFGPSFYLRNRLGPRTWRLTHRVLIPVVYVLGVWHSFARGEDLPRYSTLWVVLWVMQVPLVAAFTQRVIAPARRSEDFLGKLMDRHAAQELARQGQERARAAAGESGAGQHP